MELYWYFLNRFIISYWHINDTTMCQVLFSKIFFHYSIHLISYSGVLKRLEFIVSVG